jgi:tRNA (guanine-N7-)-methyltransferase
VAIAVMPLGCYTVCDRIPFFGGTTMRMRKKPWARPELAVCPFYVSNPAGQKGRWKDMFPRSTNPLWLELGCGKGEFAAAFAADTPEVNLLAVDIKSEVLAVAARNTLLQFAKAGRPIDNLYFTSQDIERIGDILSELDSVSGLFIHFCNPWPKFRHQKHRLTHPRQLALYRRFLLPNARLQFKTDHPGLFDDTVTALAENGYVLDEVHRALPENHFAAATMSEHEKMFRRTGVPIGFIAAHLK